MSMALFPPQSSLAPDIHINLFDSRVGLSPPIIVQKIGHQWKLSQEFSEMHRVPAVDFKIECLDLREDEFLWIIMYFFDETTKTSQKYDHIFDKGRSTFCFRRIATGIRCVRPGDNKSIVCFPITQCLKLNEDGEHKELASPLKWPYSNQLTWKVLEDGTVETEKFKNFYNKFGIGLSLQHVLSFDDPPPRSTPNWPKSQKLPVQVEFFEPAWPLVRAQLARFKMKFVSSKEFLDLHDLLGAYYHEWKFNDEKLLELNELAISHGFYSFWDSRKITMNFLKVTGSAKAADIVKPEKMNAKTEEKKMEKEDIKVYERLWNVRRIPGPVQPPSVFPITLEDNMQWNTNFFHSTYHDHEYISIGCVLNGNVQSTYKCLIEISMLSEAGGTISSRVAQRTLTSCQNSIFIPTFCRKQEADSCQGNRNGIKFKVELQMRKLKVWDHQEMNNDVELVMPGENDLVLRVDGKRISVNRNFLAHHVPFFVGLLFNENFGNQNKDEVEIETKTTENYSGNIVVHFLDTLYHGTKLFHVSQYYHVLRLADEWLCDEVVKTAGKAVMNTKCEKINKEKLEKKFNLGRFLPKSSSKYSLPVFKRRRAYSETFAPKRRRLNRVSNPKPRPWTLLKNN